MSEYREQRRSRASGWCRRVAAFAAVLGIVVWVGHHFGLVETLGYLWVLALVALLVLSPYGVVAYLMLTEPPLQAVTTDAENPPALPTATGRTGSMNALLPQSPGEQRLQAQRYPLVTGRRYQLPFDETLAAVQTVLSRQGWKQVEGPDADAEAAGEATVGAVAPSFILDLPADVSIRVTADDDATLVDMRSASRYGRHDLGDNARRITAFLAELDQQVGGLVGAAAAQ